MRKCSQHPVTRPTYRRHYNKCLETSKAFLEEELQIKLVRLYSCNDAVAVDNPTLNNPETNADKSGQSLKIYINAGLTLNLSNLLLE